MPPSADRTWTLGHSTKTAKAIVSMATFLQNRRGNLVSPPSYYNRTSFVCFVRWHCDEIAKAMASDDPPCDPEILSTMGDAVPLSTLARILNEYQHPVESQIAVGLELQKRRKCKRDFVRAKRKKQRQQRQACKEDKL